MRRITEHELLAIGWFLVALQSEEEIAVLAAVVGLVHMILVLGHLLFDGFPSG